jgi:hypothetical protein
MQRGPYVCVCPCVSVLAGRFLGTSVGVGGRDTGTEGDVPLAEWLAY